MAESAEKNLMESIRSCYGKTILTWQIDENPDVPAADPQYMMSFTGDNQVKPELISSRDEEMKIDTNKRREKRQGKLTEFTPAPGSDYWQSGCVPQLKADEVAVRKP